MTQTKKQKKKIDKVMGEFKAGTLKSGSGNKVTSKIRQWQLPCLKQVLRVK
jgi:hypothetical protein